MEKNKLIDSSELYYYQGFLFRLKGLSLLSIKNFKLYLNSCPKNSSKKLQVYLELAEIYFNEEYYEESTYYYRKIIESNNKSKEIFRAFTLSLYKELKTPEETIKELRKYLNIENNEELILLAETLFNCKLYNYSLFYFIEANKKGNSDRILIFIGKIFMYINEYKKSYDIFKLIPNESIYKDEALRNSILINLILYNEMSIEEINLINNTFLKTSLIEIDNLIRLKELTPITSNTIEILNEIIPILDIMLKTNEFNIFEKLLPILNYIESDNILLELSNLYKENEFYELASEEAINSIIKFKTINLELLNLIYTNYYNLMR